MPAPPEIESPPSVSTPESPRSFEKPNKTGDPSPVHVETDLANPANVLVDLRPPTANLHDVSIDFGIPTPETPQRRDIVPLTGDDAFGQRLIVRLQTSGTGEKVAQAFTEMSAVDVYMYNNDAGHRKQIQDVVNGLDTPTRNYVNALLNQVTETGKPPVIGAVEKVFANAMNNIDAKTAMPDIERLLTQNPELRQRLNSTDAANLSPQERALKETIKESLNRLLLETYGAHFRGGRDVSPPERAMAVKNLWEFGSLPLDMKAQHGMKSNFFYEQASQANQQEVQGLLQSGRITEKEKALIEKIAGQGGRMNLEDRLRAFAVGGNSNLADIQQELRGLSPLAMRDLRLDYFQRYHTSVETEFQRRLDVNGRTERTRLFDYDREAANREWADGRWRRLGLQ